MLIEKKMHLMGTTIKLKLDHPQANDLLDTLAAKLVIYEKRFSANDSTSELMQITHNAGKQAVKVNQELFDLISIGKKISEDTTNNLNIALGPLVQTWRIGFADAHLPSDQAIKKAMKLTDPALIILDETKQTVFLQQAGMALDLGCLAKGFITDLLLKYLTPLQPQAALLNLGGSNIYVMGQAPKGRPYWRIGLQTPGDARGTYGLILQVQNAAVVTSGVYERTLAVGEQRYHHLFDMQTGYPLTTAVTSITIIAPTALLGEIWTTAFFGQPIAHIMQKLEQLADIEGIVITADKQVYLSKGIIGRVRIINSSFKYQARYTTD